MATCVPRGPRSRQGGNVGDSPQRGADSEEAVNLVTYDPEGYTEFIGEGPRSPSHRSQHISGAYMHRNIAYDALLPIFQPW